MIFDWKNLLRTDICSSCRYGFANYVSCTSLSFQTSGKLEVLEISTLYMLYNSLLKTLQTFARLVLEVCLLICRWKFWVIFIYILIHDLWIIVLVGLSVNLFWDCAKNSIDTPRYFKSQRVILFLCFVSFSSRNVFRVLICLVLFMSKLKLISCV